MSSKISGATATSYVPPTTTSTSSGSSSSTRSSSWLLALSKLGSWLSFSSSRNPTNVVYSASTLSLLDDLEYVPIDVSKRALPSTSSPAEQRSPSPATVVRAASANLANKLCKKLVEKEPNKSLLISPPSVFAYLGMLLAYISPEKRSQYLQIMGLKDLKEDEVVREIGRLLEELPSCVINPPSAASSTILQNDIREKYNTGFIAGDPSQLVDCSVSDRPTLVNAIDLSFKWRQKFVKPAEGWPKKPFTFADKTMCLASMMHQEAVHCSMYTTPGFAMIEIPFEGKDLSLVVFMPAVAEDLKAVEDGLNDPIIQAYRSKGHQATVELHMPEMKIEGEHQFLETLTAISFPLGDLDRTTLHPELAIEGILHKTTVSIDAEETMSNVEETDDNATRPPLVKINRNFVFCIAHGDMVLVRGRVADPTFLVRE